MSGFSIELKSVDPHFNEHVEGFHRRINDPRCKLEQLASTAAIMIVELSSASYYSVVDVHDEVIKVCIEWARNAGSPQGDDRHVLAFMERFSELLNFHYNQKVRALNCAKIMHRVGKIARNGLDELEDLGMSVREPFSATVEVIVSEIVEACDGLIPGCYGWLVDTLEDAGFEVEDAMFIYGRCIDRIVKDADRAD